VIDERPNRSGSLARGAGGDRDRALFVLAHAATIPRRPGVMFWILGIPSPLLWAVLMAFVCMIPVAGSFLVWLPLSIYLMIGGYWTRAVVLIIWGALVISTIDNFLRPKLVGGQTRLHELFVFFSVLGGLSVFGLLGIVLGPVVLAITLGLLQTFQKQQEDT